ncbi:MAG: hypothetical protein DWQ07_21770 [Chloroflexi bacterium]|nr:MAG: hypothetical protein DWQ07_21770 [Chloroflexota bacterium]MBL1197320.1 hypothetical protein [Chloroflexota bacterium]NOH14616.1 hypothetical protein [Chloroflexota bacterium]
MPRKTFVPLMLIALMAMLSISAVTGDVDTFKLKTSDYIEGKGLVLKFDGVENLDPLPMDGQVTIGDKQYDLTCSLGDDGILTCVAFVPKSHFGDNATIQLGDFSFDINVREPRPEPAPEIVPLPPALVCRALASPCV